MTQATGQTKSTDISNYFIAAGGVLATSAIALALLKTADVPQFKKINISKIVEGSAVGSVLCLAVGFVGRMALSSDPAPPPAETMESIIRDFDPHAQLSRVEIFRQTCKVIPHFVPGDVLDAAKQGVEKYDSPKQIQVEKTTNENPIAIHVVHGDCLTVAHQLEDKGYGKVAVLNMANATHVGGGVQGGAAAQEENVCRRSTLYQTLTTQKYPIAEHGLIYSPSVHVFRGEETYARPNADQGSYAFFDSAREISVVTSAAPYNPQKIDAAYEADVQARIRGQILIAAAKGHRAVVLSAFGCGAFKNPPPKVAELYKLEIEQLRTEKKLGKLEVIVFAIYNDRNAPYGGNVTPFAKEFGIDGKPSLIADLPTAA